MMSKRHFLVPLIVLAGLAGTLSAQSYAAAQRKLGSSFGSCIRSLWIPAFVGISGLVLPGCSQDNSEDKSIVSGSLNSQTDIDDSEQPTVLLSSELFTFDLTKGMSRKWVVKELEAAGWHRQDPIIKGNSQLAWVFRPCEGARMDGSETFLMSSVSNPPKYFRLNLKFFDCQNDKVVNYDYLNKATIEEVSFHTYVIYQ